MQVGYSLITWILMFLLITCYTRATSWHPTRGIKWRYHTLTRTYLEWYTYTWFEITFSDR